GRGRGSGHRPARSLLDRKSGGLRGAGTRRQRQRAGRAGARPFAIGQLQGPQGSARDAGVPQEPYRQSSEASPAATAQRRSGWSAKMTVRIANGSAFWGDSAEAPLALLRGGPLDYLTLDYLAEITMSILQKLRARDPRAGYAHDFVAFVKRGAREIIERGVKVVTNAGGINPVACRDAVATLLQAAGYGGKVKIGVVTGDDIMPRLDELLDRGIALANLDTGEPLSAVRAQVQSANVYFGAFPIAEALCQGAGIVITGRCNDAALALGPMVREFGWKADDWDRISAGAIAGHVIECGAQCTGGNCQADWETIPDYAGIGYPVIEAEPDGTFVVTKQAGTGGRVSVAGVTEQLLYEICDPANYITPDGIPDFTTIQLEQQAVDRVRCSGITGRP